MLYMKKGENLFTLQIVEKILEKSGIFFCIRNINFV